VLNVARSRLARSSMRIIGATLDQEASDAVLRALQARDGTQEQIERDILVQQIVARMTPEERDLYFLQAWGHSVREIARACGKSEGHVNTLVYRMRLRIRELLQPTRADGSESMTRQPPKRRTM
jgi:DNA-directed RNA polymerase specialized sigma24 family protein